MSGALVIGLGNRDRGDDAVGLAVAEAVAALAPAGVRVECAAPDPLALLARWQGAGTVVLVDAAAPQGRPGRLHVLDAGREALPRALGLGSTHAFGLAQTVELARGLGQLPPRLLVYAIEAAGFGHGAALSPAVAAAVSPAARRIVGDLAAAEETRDA